MDKIKTWQDRAEDQFKASAELLERKKTEVVMDAMRAEIADLRAALASSATTADQNELHLNATRLRNVAALAGLKSAIPEDDATLDGARGSVLGMIAGKLRSAPVTDLAAAILALPLPTQSAWGFKSIYGHDPDDGSKQLIGVSVGRGGKDSQKIEVALFTADQVRALLAAAAALAKQVPAQEQDASLDLLPEDIRTDDALWRAGCKAFRAALNEMTGRDGYVVMKTYDALRAHVLAKRT